MGTRWFGCRLAILWGLALAAGAAEIPQHAAFRSNSYLVLIHATVLDPAHRPVRGLTQDRFRLFQDKAQQNIAYFSEEEAPLSLAIVFDTSGSMRNKISGAYQALRAVLETSNPGDEFSLITFANQAKLAVPWVPDETQIATVAAITHPEGKTSLLDAIHLALAQTKRASNPRRAILILSDGGDNHSQYREREIAGQLEEADVQMYSVDMEESPYLTARSDEELEGPDLLERLCERAGGRYFHAQNSRELATVADRISKELRSIYVLGFVPPNGVEDGRFHYVQLKLDRPAGGPKLSVYWRQGYRVPSE
ncbi:MAG TPA: VWA domain-containing protein [Bryobacteraceae bacterium]|nr:VWA domain-containing protein [Bryobacteraceae bacterium]